VRRRTFLIGGAAAIGVTTAAAAAGGRFLAQRHDPNRRTYGSTTLRRSAPAADGPNVLFISLDDCNDWLGFLNNHPGTSTPNLDALAAESIVFSNAYCTAPMCLPARTGVMFGKQPYEVGVYDHTDASRDHYDEMAARTSSLVDAMWAGGYQTLGTGKVFHGSQGRRWSTYRRSTTFVDPSEGAAENSPTNDPSWISPYDGQPVGDGSRMTGAMIDFGPSGDSLEATPDGETTAWVTEQLAQPREGPFFLAYGLGSTHTPWRIPRRFFDLHPLEGVVVPNPPVSDLDDISGYARDLIDWTGTYRELELDGLREEAVQAYQAAISYADDRVGVALDALASSPYANDTIVVVWSDHGFHLGEKLHWHKFTLWEPATHIPLVVRVPGRAATVFDRPVSAIDIWPTVTDLCHVEDPAGERGTSLVRMVDDPALADERPPIMTWLARNHAVRRGPWRYIRYKTGDTELYDHRVDPDEMVNLSGTPAAATIEKELAAFLPEES
jgi:arylsulfatase A-like enzyme